MSSTGHNRCGRTSSDGPLPAAAWTGCGPSNLEKGLRGGSWEPQWSSGHLSLIRMVGGAHGAGSGAIGYPVLNSYYVSGSVLSFFPTFLHLAHQNDLWGGYCPCFADGEMISRCERFGSLTGRAEIHGQSSWVQVPVPHPLTPTVWRRQGEKWRAAQCLPGSIDQGVAQGSADSPHSASLVTWATPVGLSCQGNDVWGWNSRRDGWMATVLLLFMAKPCSKLWVLGCFKMWSLQSLCLGTCSVFNSVTKGVWLTY